MCAATTSAVRPGYICLYLAVKKCKLHTMHDAIAVWHVLLLPSVIPFFAGILPLAQGLACGIAAGMGHAWHVAQQLEWCQHCCPNMCHYYHKHCIVFLQTYAAVIRLTMDARKV